MDHSPFSRRFGVFACFIEGRQNLYFTTLPAAKQESLMREFIHLSFRTALGTAEIHIPEPESFLSFNWADQGHARGAYTSYAPPGVLSVPQYWAAYQRMEKVPNVLLA